MCGRKLSALGENVKLKRQKKQICVYFGKYIWPKQKNSTSTYWIGRNGKKNFLTHLSMKSIERLFLPQS
jgi:hypothetical protein